MRTQPWNIARKLLAVLLLCLVLLSACGRQTQIAHTATERPTPTDSPEIETAPTSAAEAMPALKEAPEESEAASRSAQAAETLWSDEPLCDASSCGGLIITQDGQPQRARTGEQSLAPGARTTPLPDSLSESGRWKIDTGQPSPDGNWVAYTSLGYESGGPVFLQNQESGEWTNLITAMNQRLGAQAALPMDYWWDVIGWFPESRQIMVGPSDLSFVAVVDIASSTVKLIPFDGGGRGGRLFVNLAPDGKRFIFTGDDEKGQQAFKQYDLASGEVTDLYALSYDQGFISNPRFAPDGESVAFVTQKGPMGATGDDTLNLLPANGGSPRTLIEGNLWLAVPTWSPDGERLAFSMAEEAAPALTAAEAQSMDIASLTPRGNVWVVILEGEAEQLTFVDGLARSPAWSNDGNAVAFVTHDGQVGLADANEPGRMWQVSGPAEEAPEFISAFFLP